jgi:epoxide hydrolase
VTQIDPFRIDISDSQLEYVQKRMAASVLPVWTDESWESGPPREYAERLRGRLAAGYDWRSREAALNEHPQFLTEIEGQKIHFLHIKSSERGATPLLLIHGWPSSFAEFLDLVRPLTEPSANGGHASDAFDVVIPSLPGFAFSGPTHEKGWNNRRIGSALLELMKRLGYERFGIQGGDAGAIIGPEIGRLGPSRVLGIHLNAATMGFIPLGPLSAEDLATLSDPEKTRIQRLQRFMAEHFGFNAIQSTRPQTLAYALSDSPIGGLAWMCDLFTSFGDRPTAIPEDTLLTNFLIYWFTNTFPSSIRLYFENARDPQAWAPKANSGVPTGVAVFGHDEVAIRRFGEQANSIVRWTEFETGGHFAAIEEPRILAEDIRAFFSSVRRNARVNALK